MDKQMVCHPQLDLEWIHLMRKAKELGLTVEEVREYFSKHSSISSKIVETKE
ncbi:anti-repressor SinI family protein [Halobacillus mangrovi]|uniref:anti-repressor SinI family protein n=1 Tax=Halobacillus mangrovi TaxID=402384 RepID=UPI001E462EC1|nr:anti-repressor SinI family protein [Halobacillus mangrovi]